MTCWVLERGIIAAITAEDALTLVLGEEELTLMPAAAKTKGSIFDEKIEDKS
jgi:hypothetical protein